MPMALMTWPERSRTGSATQRTSGSNSTSSNAHAGAPHLGNLAAQALRAGGDWR